MHRYVQAHARLWGSTGARGRARGNDRGENEGASGRGGGRHTGIAGGGGQSARKQVGRKGGRMGDGDQGTECGAALPVMLAKSAQAPPPLQGPSDGNPFDDGLVSRPRSRALPDAVMEAQTNGSTTTQGPPRTPNGQVKHGQYARERLREPLTPLGARAVPGTSGQTGQSRLGAGRHGRSRQGAPLRPYGTDHGISACAQQILWGLCDARRALQATPA